MKRTKSGETIFELFMETLEETVVCPYCGDSNQLDPPLLCCGEVHAERAWRVDDEDETFLMEHELSAACDVWAKRKGYQTPLEAKEERAYWKDMADDERRSEIKTKERDDETN
jgi:hypothetical protein